ncbi:hypothetical protein LO763_08825 [Glycomyces sp. A-F 0318]|uniref:hypothetical protein n=1 Tax=Glycomyces amatae TaxID=2881355 RepID=UPI001E35E5B8|nr:hypothetical protein [Glycomyces amatae]MCD0443723.1 hypothetical protein [Glycomyces amatae]
MNVLFIAPRAKRKRAVAVETRRALADGHRVLLVAEAGTKRDGWDLDPRVEVAWLRANAIVVPERRSTALLTRRLPLGVLRRLGRGPLRGPAAKAARLWKRIVVNPLKRRRKRATEALREPYRLDRVRDALRSSAPDWLVLCEPSALELAVDFVPDFLAERPRTRTTYAYEPIGGGTDER